MRNRYLDIDDRIEDLTERMQEQPTIASDFLEKYELSWIYHENALEGVIYTSHELSIAMANQPVADATIVGAFQEIRNHKAAIDLVRVEAANKKPKLSLALIKRIYEILGNGIQGKNVADFRKDIPLHRSYFHEIAHPTKIAAQLDKLMELCESSDWKNSHPLQQASKVHHAFMQVYPFTENSGKVARLISNLILLNKGYLPCIIHSIDRQRYYESLRVPEAILRELMMEAMDNALANAEKFFDEAQAARAKQVAH